MIQLLSFAFILFVNGKDDDEVTNKINKSNQIKSKTLNLKKIILPMEG